MNLIKQKKASSAICIVNYYLSYLKPFFARTDLHNFTLHLRLVTCKAQKVVIFKKSQYIFLRMSKVNSKWFSLWTVADECIILEISYNKSVKKMTLVWQRKVCIITVLCSTYSVKGICIVNNGWWVNYFRDWWLYVYCLNKQFNVTISNESPCNHCPIRYATSSHDR